MKLKAKLLLSILIIVPGLITISHAADIQDIIQPVKISYGRLDTLPISDLFYAKAYDLKFIENDKFTVSYDKEHNTVIFQPKNNFIGVSLIEFTIHGKKYCIPVIAENGKASQQLHTFIYQSREKVSMVAVCGSFNNWSKEKDRLIDTKGQGVYELTLPLDPGSYIYKFVVDGKEIVDPTNPEKSPTGFDGFNSVLRVADTDTAKIFLHIDGHTETTEGASFFFVYENTGQSLALTQIDTTKIVLNKNTIEIRLSKNELKKEKMLRLLVFQQGKTTNMQQVVLRNGIPAGEKSPVWSWNDGIIYSIMIDRFSDGDQSNDKPVVHDSIFFPANYLSGSLQCAIIPTMRFANIRLHIDGTAVITVIGRSATRKSKRNLVP
jgi:hypothetical protein